MSGWVLGASAVVTAGAGLYGASKNSKAVKQANAANAASAAKTDALNYQRWLETQGVGPNGEVVNAGYPRWLSVRIGGNRTPGPRRLIRVGSNRPTVQASPYGTYQAQLAQQAAAVAPNPEATKSSSKYKPSNMAKMALDQPWDPLDLF